MCLAWLKIGSANKVGSTFTEEMKVEKGQWGERDQMEKSRKQKKSGSAGKDMGNGERVGWDGTERVAVDTAGSNAYVRSMQGHATKMHVAMLLPAGSHLGSKRSEAKTKKAEDDCGCDGMGPKRVVPRGRMRDGDVAYWCFCFDFFSSFREARG